MENLICDQHSGFEERIKTVEKNNTEQWTHINELGDKVNENQNKIMTRINVVLGGIAVACILLTINMAIP